MDGMERGKNGMNFVQIYMHELLSVNTTFRVELKPIQTLINKLYNSKQRQSVCYSMDGLKQVIYCR